MPAREQTQVIEGYGDRLLQRLRALKMSQSQLAERAQVSRQTLYRAIHRDELTGRVAKKIAAVVGADLFAPGTPGGPGVAAVARESEARSVVESPAGQVTAPTPALSWFGEVLELLREDQCMTQEDAAEAAGISVTTYRRVIAGATAPKQQWVVKLGESFEVRDPEGLYAIRNGSFPDDPF
jgi:transcriptional regulator with XRE-family HTH domain